MILRIGIFVLILLALVIHEIAYKNREKVNPMEALRAGNFKSHFSFHLPVKTLRISPKLPNTLILRWFWLSLFWCWLIELILIEMNLYLSLIFILTLLILILVLHWFDFDLDLNLVLLLGARFGCSKQQEQTKNEYEIRSAPNQTIVLQLMCLFVS